MDIVFVLMVISTVTHQPLGPIGASVTRDRCEALRAVVTDLPQYEFKCIKYTVAE